MFRNIALILVCLVVASTTQAATPTYVAQFVQRIDNAKTQERQTVAMGENGGVRVSMYPEPDVMFAVTHGFFGQPGIVIGVAKGDTIMNFTDVDMDGLVDCANESRGRMLPLQTKSGSRCQCKECDQVSNSEIINYWQNQYERVLKEVSAILL